MLTLEFLLISLLALPLMASLILMFFGRRFGEPFAGYFGTGIAVLVFGITTGLLVTWIYKSPTWGYETGPFLDLLRWLPIGVWHGQRDPGFLELAIYVDSLSIVMASMVAFISALVHLFSLGYMKDDPRYPQFFSYLSLFSFCMMGLLISGSLVQLLIFFELVGLCSYLLIGFWREKRASSRAAIKAFVMNRVGDVGFIAGIGILIASFGTTTLPDLWLILGDTGGGVMSYGLLTVVGVLLAMGAFGKSAQFPFHTWLPDAMAGPTPVSALIHAATMVAAGVFLLARIYPILTADARLFVLIIGATTILLGSVCALAQRDLKKALAFSTIAQLGYMVLAIGVGSWTGATFHLLTHAFFKALLFLGAGNVMHTMHHEGRLEQYGGLFRRMPVTAVTFGIGILAISAAPFLSGFFSKDMILAHASAYTELAGEENRGWILQLALWVPVIAAYLTPLYMTRLWMLTFAGKPRKRRLYKQAGEAGIMSFPLVLLSGMSIVAGYSWFPIESLINGTIRETRGYFDAMPALDRERSDPMASVWPVLEIDTEQDVEAGESVETRPIALTPTDQRVQRGYETAHHLTGWAWLIGILSGILIWFRGFAVTDRLARFKPLALMRHAAAHGFYFDDLYELVFVGSVQILTSVAVAIDRYLIDPLIDFAAYLSAGMGRLIGRVDDAAVDGVVRGIGYSVWQGGGMMRLTQNGRIRVYVASATAIIVLILICVVIIGLVS